MRYTPENPIPIRISIKRLLSERLNIFGKKDSPAANNIINHEKGQSTMGKVKLTITESKCRGGYC
ncbi:hypothetical protein, partial [Dysgonomonas gadei]|uniref:hypothetical protein n=1 Tax=Dysgonomonas gadei TaxID=156974 RepID=UPI003AF0CA38